MAFIIDDQKVGWQAIADTDTTQRHGLGMIVRAVDPTYGYGEFIYMKGVTSTVRGSWVTYNPDDWTTALIVADAKGPVAVAMSANAASTSYGWYQISGKNPAAVAADVADDADVYIDTVAGMCDDAQVTGDRVWGAKWASTDDTTSDTSVARAEVELARPFVTDAQNSGT